MRETDLLEPNSYYAVAKCAQTLVCQHFAHAERRPVNTLRLFSAFGPYEEPTRLIPTIVTRCLRKTRPLDLVSRDIARDFVYVEDVVDAFLCIEQLAASPREIINIGTGVQSTVGDVVEAVLQYTAFVQRMPLGGDAGPHLGRQDLGRRLLEERTGSSAGARGPPSRQVCKGRSIRFRSQEGGAECTRLTRQPPRPGCPDQLPDLRRGRGRTARSTRRTFDPGGPRFGGVLRPADCRTGSTTGWCAAFAAACSGRTPSSPSRSSARLYGASHFTYQREAAFTGKTYAAYLRRALAGATLAAVTDGGGLRQRVLPLRGGADGDRGGPAESSRSQEAIEHAEPELRGRIRCALYDTETFEPERFDVICAFQVFDHVPDSGGRCCGPVSATSAGRHGAVHQPRQRSAHQPAAGRAQPDRRRRAHRALRPEHDAADPGGDRVHRPGGLRR